MLIYVSMARAKEMKLIYRFVLFIRNYNGYFPLDILYVFVYYVHFCNFKFYINILQ